MHFSGTLGLFKHIEGDFIYDESSNSVKNLSIIVNTDSVFTNHEKRDSHLRSPDFLNTDQYPTMAFEVKEYALNDTPGQIKGNLTLLGITKPINLDFKINIISLDPTIMKKRHNLLNIIPGTLGMVMCACIYYF